MTKKSISELVPARMKDEIQTHLSYVWYALGGDQNYDPAIAQQATIQVWEQVQRLMMVHEAHTALIANLKSLADELAHQRDIMLWERDWWASNGKAEAVAKMAAALVAETGEKDTYVKMVIEILIGDRDEYISAGARRQAAQTLISLLDEIFEESA